MSSIKRERPPSPSSSLIFSVNDSDTDSDNDNGFDLVAKSSRSQIETTNTSLQNKSTFAKRNNVKDEHIDPSLDIIDNDNKGLLPTPSPSPSRKKTKATTPKVKVKSENSRGFEAGKEASTSAKARMAEIILEFGIKSYDRALVENETGLTKAQQVEMLKRGRGSMYKALMGFASTL